VKKEKKHCTSHSLVDEDRRHFLILATKIMGAIAAFFAFKPFIASWFPSAKTRRNALPVMVDLSQLQPGQQHTVLWRGKPVSILRRTKTELYALQTQNEKLRDPLSLVAQQPKYAQNKYRARHPEFMVWINICTHLGCTPRYQPSLLTKEVAGLYCPCHGSTFDLAGRVFKGMPAPINLAIPPYYFKTPTLLVIGEDQP
jgi:ubiquinol-cytochrome c reductase iron-sulfur subunit